MYEADRPELFLKDAGMRRTVGPGGTIRVRSDSTWTVPEPELGLVLGEGGAPVAVTIGNDVSSRDIEGANPLYIPQAKVFAGACAIGPALLVPDDWSVAFPIRLRITDGDGRVLHAGATSTAKLKRSLHELAEWLMRDNPVPPGSVLLTARGSCRRMRTRSSPGTSSRSRSTASGCSSTPSAIAWHLPVKGR